MQSRCDKRSSALLNVILVLKADQPGELLYSGRLGAPGYYSSSPVAADNKIYIASEEGVVVVLAAGEQLKVLATKANTNPRIHTN